MPAQHTVSLRFVSIFLGVALTTMTNVAVAQEPLQTITFRSSSDDFLNPERGFMRFRDLTDPFAFDQVRSSGSTLIYGRILADAFRAKPLTDSFLSQIQAGFDLARANGIKVKPRVAYNDGLEPDAPKAIILQHIQQLQPIWAANKDVISHLDAGFIGAWGEWHTSTNGLDNPTDRAEILSAILNSLPADRMVGIRTPHYKRQIYSGSPTSDAVVITAETAFDGSNLSRVGHLNDCFLSSSNDVGTYAYTNQGWSRSREIDYIGGESRFVPFGGETCALHPLGESANAISEMKRLHIDYLNRDYNKDVIQRWVVDGTYDEISRGLGYRFELQTAELPDAAKPSGLLELHFDVENVGYGELFNPRQVEVTLTHQGTGDITRAPLSIDPRHWTGGTSHHIETFLAIPASLPVGDYSVGLALPDIETSLKQDVRYAIQFANARVWDAASGINRLKSDLKITEKAAGPVYTGLDSFIEIADPSALNLLGDFDGNRHYDCADADELVATIAAGANTVQFDMNGDDVVDHNDLGRWRAVAGAASLPAGAAYLPADANLDGVVDMSDLDLWNANKFTSTAAWCAGDFNADGFVDGSDFNIWYEHKFTSSNPATVPEPDGLLVTLLAAFHFFQRLGLNFGDNHLRKPNGGT